MSICQKLILISLLSFPFLTYGREPQKADPKLQSILEKHGKAIGLEERLKIKTLISYGTIEQLGEQLKITILQKRPNKYRMDIHLNDGRITQSYDGRKGWSLNPYVSSDTLRIEGMELGQLMESALFDGVLFNASELNYSLEYKGEDHIKTSGSYLILLTKPSGDQLKFYIDKKDYLVKRTEASFNMGGFSYQAVSEFSDFRKENGITLPFSIQNSNGQLATKMKIDQLKFDEKLEDGLFSGIKN